MRSNRRFALAGAIPERRYYRHDIEPSLDTVNPVSTMLAFPGTCFKFHSGFPLSVSVMTLRVGSLIRTRVVGGCDSAPEKSPALNRARSPSSEVVPPLIPSRRKAIFITDARKSAGTEEIFIARNTAANTLMLWKISNPMLRSQAVVPFSAITVALSRVSFACSR